MNVTKKKKKKSKKGRFQDRTRQPLAQSNPLPWSKHIYVNGQVVKFFETKPQKKERKRFDQPGQKSSFRNKLKHCVMRWNSLSICWCCKYVQLLGIYSTQNSVRGYVLCLWAEVVVIVVPVRELRQAA